MPAVVPWCRIARCSLPCPQLTARAAPVHDRRRCIGPGGRPVLRPLGVGEAADLVRRGRTLRRRRRSLRGPARLLRRLGLGRLGRAGRARWRLGQRDGRLRPARRRRANLDRDHPRPGRRGGAARSRPPAHAAGAEARRDQPRRLPDCPGRGRPPKYVAPDTPLHQSSVQTRPTTSDD